MRNDLEHGWLLSRENEYKGEFVGYCERCERPIYEYDDFTKRHGELICQDCIEREYDDELLEDDLW